MHYLLAALQLCFAILLVGLIGCGAEEDLAATVNQVPISIAEVDALLAERYSTVDSATSEQRNDVLEELISQQLLVQAAYDLDLELDPAVMNATHEILARAYIGRQLAHNDLMPGAGEIEEFYNANPELFAERKRYQLQEIAINASEPELDDVHDYVDQISTLQELVTWLDNRNMTYQTGAAIKSADELAGDLLAYLKDRKDGELVKVRRPKGLIVVQLVRRFADPVPLADARADIVKFLRNRQFERKVESVTKNLRAQAKIERFPTSNPSEEPQ